MFNHLLHVGQQNINLHAMIMSQHCIPTNDQTNKYLIVCSWSNTSISFLDILTLGLKQKI